MKFMSGNKLEDKLYQISQMNAAVASVFETTGHGANQTGQSEVAVTAETTGEPESASDVIHKVSEFMVWNNFLNAFEDILSPNEFQTLSAIIDNICSNDQKLRIGLSALWKLVEARKVEEIDSADSGELRASAGTAKKDPFSQYRLTPDETKFVAELMECHPLLIKKISPINIIGILPDDFHVDDYASYRILIALNRLDKTLPALNIDHDNGNIVGQIVEEDQSELEYYDLDDRTTLLRWAKKLQADNFIEISTLKKLPNGFMAVVKWLGWRDEEFRQALLLNFPLFIGNFSSENKNHLITRVLHFFGRADTSMRNSLKSDLEKYIATPIHVYTYLNAIFSEKEITNVVKMAEAVEIIIRLTSSNAELLTAIFNDRTIYSSYPIINHLSDIVMHVAISTENPYSNELAKFLAQLVNLNILDINRLIVYLGTVLSYSAYSDERARKIRNFISSIMEQVEESKLDPSHWNFPNENNIIVYRAYLNMAAIYIRFQTQKEEVVAPWLFQKIYNQKPITNDFYAQTIWDYVSQKPAERKKLLELIDKELLNDFIMGSQQD